MNTAPDGGVTRDAAGNTLSDGSGRSFTYNAAGRLQAASVNGTAVASYAYRANGLRARALMSAANTAGPGCKPKKKPPKKPKPKCAPGVPGTVVYHYDLAGHLIGETDELGELITDYVYAGGTPLAQLDRDGLTDTLTYLHTDHLNTPRLATSPTGTAVWRWDGGAFGETVPNNDPDGDGNLTTINLRYPGQYFDSETGLHYNWNRYYDPKTGSYITSDPIGLRGGLNTYTYVNNNPLRWIDPLGLDWFRPPGAPYYAGREGTIVEPGPIGIGRFIDDYVPAGYTFAQMHDNLVGAGTAAGLPDWLVNIPTMSSVYGGAVAKEAHRSIVELVVKGAELLFPHAQSCR